MAEENEKIIIDVQVDTAKMQQELAGAIEKVAELKVRQKELRQEIEMGNDANGEGAKELARVSAELEKNQRVVKNHTAMLQLENETIDTNNMSLDEQRQRLNALQKAYGQLSGAERKAADMKGGLRDTIKQLTDSIREQEHAIGDDRRSVGNYRESIIAAAKDLGPMKGLLEGVGGGANVMSKGFDRADKVAKGLMANPLWGTFFLLGGILSTIAAKLKQNEKAMEPIQTLTAGIGGSLEALKPMLQWVLDFLTKWFIKGVEKAMEWAKAALGWIDKIAKKFGKDLGLVSAFDAGAAAADKATESTDKLGKSFETAAEKAKRLRDERLKEWLAEEQWREDTEKAMEALNAKSKEAEKAAAKALEEQRKALDALNASLVEEEEGDPVESVEAMCRRMFGLDSAGVEYFQKLLGEGVGAHEAAQRAIQDQVQRSKEAMTQAFSNVGSSLQGLSDALGEFGEANKAAATAQKVLAGGAIAVNQAISIAEGAKGIAAAMAGAAEAAAATGPAAPFTLIAFQAQMVGQVLAVVASVASTIAQAKQLLSSSDAGKYATGGIIPGRSYSGDRMIAHVNSGEAVITREGQARLLELANGSPSSNYEKTFGAMRAALASMPAPVLAYEEFRQFEQTTANYEEIASI